MSHEPITRSRHSKALWTPLGREVFKRMGDEMVEVVQRELGLERADAELAVIDTLCVLALAKAGDTEFEHLAELRAVVPPSATRKV